jgi:hypothetical protein
LLLRGAWVRVTGGLALFSLWRCLRGGVVIKSLTNYSDQLEQTLAAMHKDGWRCCLQMVKQGIPNPYYEQFTASLAAQILPCGGHDSHDVE